jgi:arabinofuranan 3-O-arabinosyltransferase
VQLDEQTVIALAAGITQLDVTITAVAGGEPLTGGAVQGVGFAEVVTGLEPTVEVVRPPVDALAELTPSSPLTVALTRLRADPMDRWRDDPEAVLVREIDLHDERSFTPAIDVRLDARAGDAELAAAFGWPAAASTRLTGSVANAGVSAIDGDPGTSWITAFGAASGATLRIDGVTAPVDRISVQQPVSGFSTVLAITVRSGADERTVELAPDAAGTATAVIDPPLPGGTIEVVLAAVEPATTLDRRFGDPVELPAAIAEIALPGLPAVTPVAASSLSVECAPMLSLDGDMIEASVTLTGQQAIDGAAGAAEPCAPTVDLAQGTHRIAGAPGVLPITVDRVVLVAPLPAPAARDLDEGPTATVVDDGRFDRTVEVTGCPEGCWLVFGEGHNVAWTASVDGRALGEPELVDGGFNGWWLDGAERAITIDIRWTQQRRLDLAFLVSIAGVVAAGALVLVGGRRRRAERTDRIGPGTTTSPIEGRLAPTAFAKRPAGMSGHLALVGVWAVLAGLLIQPEWAVWGAVAGVVAASWRRTRLAELTALATLVVVAGLVVLRERRNAPAPGGGWPLVFDQWHGLALFAVVSLVVGALFADDAEPDPAGADRSDRFEQDRHRSEAGDERNQVG